MYTIFNTPLIREKCPDNMTEKDCPLRKYIASEQDLFYVSANETYLIPNEYNREKFMRIYDEMHAVCVKCKTDNIRIKAR